MYFGMLDFGRVVPTSFMTASKATNRMRKNRKWIFDIRTGNGMIVQMEDESETVAACTQIKDDIKQMKTT
jgi:hypothetical protein